MLKVLFAYPLSIGSTTYELYKAMERNSNIKLNNLFGSKLTNGVYGETGNSLISKAMIKFKLPLDNLKLNSKLLEYNLSDIDILFTVKGNTIKPSTLKYIKLNYPNVKIVSWSQDDMYSWHNRSIYYTLGLKYYDLIVTQKSYNVDELKSLGAKNVLFQNKAYSRDIHKPYKCNNNIKPDVLFIGYYEKERYESMLYLANNGIKIDIFGSLWGKYANTNENLIIHNKMLVGEEYAKALSCSKISLCFLRKINRDLQTSRSIEIPACGGFMIAERTEEHKMLFKEDVEAVYFDSNEELLQKVKYYLENDNERKSIAQAGYERTRKDDYSYDNRVNEILRRINES